MERKSNFQDIAVVFDSFGFKKVQNVPLNVLNRALLGSVEWILDFIIEEYVHLVAETYSNALHTT